VGTPLLGVAHRVAAVKARRKLVDAVRALNGTRILGWAGRQRSLGAAAAGRRCERKTCGGRVTGSVTLAGDHLRRNV
jgi:hypothetical protein